MEDFFRSLSPILRMPPSPRSLFFRLTVLDMIMVTEWMKNDCNCGRRYKLLLLAYALPEKWSVLSKISYQLH